MFLHASMLAQNHTKVLNLNHLFHYLFISHDYIILKAISSCYIWVCRFTLTLSLPHSIKFIYEYLQVRDPLYFHKFYASTHFIPLTRFSAFFLRVSKLGCWRAVKSTPWQKVEPVPVKSTILTDSSRFRVFRASHSSRKTCNKNSLSNC